MNRGSMKTLEVRSLTKWYGSVRGAEDVTFAIAHAVSDNRFKRLDLTETKALFGYDPQADAFDLFAGARERPEREGGT